MPPSPSLGNPGGVLLGVRKSGPAAVVQAGARVLRFTSIGVAPMPPTFFPVHHQTSVSPRAVLKTNPKASLGARLRND